MKNLINQIKTISENGQTDAIKIQTIQQVIYNYLEKNKEGA